MNIVFGSDRGYLPHLAVAIKSLIAHHNEQLYIYILHTELNDTDWCNLTSLDTEKKHRFFNCKVDSAQVGKLVTKGQFTVAMYYRLLIETLIPCERVIYIDSDVVVNQSLIELWDMPLKDNFVAAVEEPIFTGDYLGLPKGAKYLNSGVMLMDLRQWRNHNISQKVIGFIEEKGAVLIWPDQCAINFVLSGKWLAISPKYNMQTNIFDMDSATRSERYPFPDLIASLKSPAIIHYTGASKPWHLLNRHPLKKLYWKYLRQTPYSRFFPSDMSAKKMMFWLLPKKIRVFFRKE